MDYYRLIDIKNWYVNNSKLIPDIQRDLVWSPKQIIMLWDSILRGFPIGSFIILQKEDGLLQVLDGQQRINAIAQGFGTYNTSSNKKPNILNEPDIVLWLDLNGTAQGTMQFPLMATTKSQPWGYNNDEDCSKLSSQTRRESLKEYFGNDFNSEDIYNCDISLYQTWPAKASAPVPLQIILNHITDSSESDFADNIMIEFMNSKFLYKNRVDTKCFLKLKEYYKYFSKLNEYLIGNPSISNSILESENNNMEILFHRINRGGTNMSDDDLAYSTIKAHYVGIKEKDSSVSTYIAPAKLARLLFRIIDSEGKDSFVGNLSIKRIRENSKDKVFKNNLSEYYRDIERTIGLIEGVFDICSVPKALRIDLANKTSDLYMLLLYLAIKGFGLELDSRKQFVCGLVLYLKWFCDDISRTVSLIKKHLINNGYSETIFKKAISEAIGFNLITPVIIPNQLRRAFKIDAVDKWSPPQGNITESWNKFRENRELLLFFQREFINKSFSKYNPANSKLWDDNRPWDYDHVIPQNWFANYSAKNQFARFNRYWQNNIGNLAAIPFERNRSKRDNADWNYYLQSGLLSKDTIKLLHGIDSRFNQDKDQANLFAKLTFSRSCSIYEYCYDQLFGFLELKEDKDLTENISRRMVLLQDINHKIEDSSLHYVTKDALREERMLQTEDDNLSIWCMPWLSCGKIIGDYYVALAIGLDEKVDKLYFEIGIRRKPGDSNIISERIRKWGDVNKDGYTEYNNDWWYIERDLSEDEFNCLNIPEEMNKLSKLVDL